MSIRIVHYRFEGQLKVEAETDDEARMKFQQVSASDLAAYCADSLTVEWVEEEKPLLPEPEGLSQLKSGEMVRI